MPLRTALEAPAATEPTRPEPHSSQRLASAPCPPGARQNAGAVPPSPLPLLVETSPRPPIPCRSWHALSVNSIVVQIELGQIRLWESTHYVLATVPMRDLDASS